MPKHRNSLQKSLGAYALSSYALTYVALTLAPGAFFQAARGSPGASAAGALHDMQPAAGSQYSIV